MELMRRIVPGLSLLLLVLVLLIPLSGCGDDDDPVQLPEDPPVGPGTPEDLLAGILTAYEDMDLKNYLALLDPEFSFVLHPRTGALYPDLDGALDIDLEEKIHRRMFSGEAVTDPEGNPRPGVVQVSFSHLQALDTWINTDDPGNFPETKWAPFQVELLIDCGSNFTTYRAEGQLKIYVREYTRMAGGKEVKYFKLAGMVDLTDSGKGVENTPWGLIKVFYR